MSWNIEKWSELLPIFWNFRTFANLTNKQNLSHLIPNKTKARP